MERVIGLERRGSRSRDERLTSERLRHRRAAAERCVRTGLLRVCTPVPPGGCGCAGRA